MMEFFLPGITNLLGDVGTNHRADSLSTPPYALLGLVVDAIIIQLQRGRQCRIVQYTQHRGSTCVCNIEEVHVGMTAGFSG